MLDSNCYFLPTRVIRDPVAAVQSAAGNGGVAVSGKWIPTPHDAQPTEGTSSLEGHPGGPWEQIERLKAELAECQRKSERMQHALQQFAGGENWVPLKSPLGGTSFEWIRDNIHPVELARKALED